ncbi:MAG TPA: ABC transporter ATP-binding protein [Bacteroidota bacterium]|nr:ABC transporter ATP-binding protein [Bacteroidota bacterium]
MADAVILKDVAKVYEGTGKKQVNAVNGITLNIRQGEIFCFVGPDGAGKTTTIRMICGVLPPSQGSIHMLGFDVQSEKKEIKKHIGYLSQRFSLYQDLTIDENIDFFAEIHRIKQFHQRKEELLEFTRLTPFRDRLSGRLSGGMKQKLALACTLIHTPDILLLDEPTTGVDPVSRRDFWKILSSLLKTGMTIIVSTPYLDEAERSSRVAMMNDGTILQCDTPNAIRDSFRTQILELVCSDVHRSAAVLSVLWGKERIQLFGDRLHVMVMDATKDVQQILSCLAQSNIHVDGHRLLPPSLEDVFIARLGV